MGILDVDTLDFLKLILLLFFLMFSAMAFFLAEVFEDLSASTGKFD
jgi:hypothetical protein